MNMWLESEAGTAMRVSTETSRFDLHVRGEIPRCLEGALIVATSRRHKDRSFFARWHDSQADLLKLDLSSGRPGRVTANFLAVDPNWLQAGKLSRSSFYATQPNHGLNCSSDKVWATRVKTH